MPTERTGVTRSSRQSKNFHSAQNSSFYSKTCKEPFNVCQRPSWQRYWVLGTSCMVRWKQNLSFRLKWSSSCLEETETAYDPKNTVPTVKHGGGGILVWGCFIVHGTGELHIIDGKMDSSMYKQILELKLQPSEMKSYGRSKWIFQQDNDPKHTGEINKRIAQK